MNLECPKCKNIWNYNGKANRIQCIKCKKFFRLEYKKPAKNKQNLPKIGRKAAGFISDSIMRGNILDALEKADINPLNSNGKLSKRRKSQKVKCWNCRYYINIKYFTKTSPHTSPFISSDFMTKIP